MVISQATSSELKKAGTRGRQAMTVWANLVQQNPRAGFELAPQLTAALDHVRLLVDVSIDAKVVANNCGASGDIDEVLNRMAAISKLTMVQPKPSEVYDQHAMDLGTEINKLWKKLTLVVVATHFVKYRSLNNQGSSEHTWTTVTEQIGGLATQLHDLEAALSKHRKDEVHGKYKHVLSPCTKVASKRAFLAADLPVEIRPQTIIDGATGKETADPYEILDNTTAKYKEMWKCTDKKAPAGMGPLWGGSKPMPKLQVARIRRASQLFKKKTATSFDGIHPRHIMLLSDEGIRALADL